MQVRLKVIRGASEGAEIQLPRSEFVIGRSDGCHLRPHSDMVSRRHCAFEAGESKVVVRDLGSKNGTLVNGQRIEGEQTLRMGDVIKVGPLEFEVVIDHGLSAPKRPKVKDIKDAAARTSESGIGFDEGDITQWLEEADEEDRARRLADPETRQFKLDPQEQAALEKAAADNDADKKKGRPEKKEPGKLPQRTAQLPTDSREAAAETLKKFFNRGP